MSCKKWLDDEMFADNRRMMNVRSFILPMLGCWRQDFGWFKDVFCGDEEHPQHDDNIHVYAKIAGACRDEYQVVFDRFKGHPNYIDNFDDSVLREYATIVFSVPDEWRSDFDLWDAGKIDEISGRYRDVVKAKMAEKELDPRFFDLMIEDLKCQE